MVPVVEIFPALQGEGVQMGVPSIFVRLGGCTLTCSGFNCSAVSALDNKTVIKGCDSIFAVNAKHFKHLWNYHSEFSTLVQEIEKCTVKIGKYQEKQDIVFTGGEPLLHHKDDVLINTLEYFISRGHRVFFETNGTVDVNFEEYPIFRDVNFTISVKMATSGEPLHKRWHPEIVNKYLKNTKHSYFKFVLSKEQIENNQEDEITEFLKLVPTFAVVYIMPLGETKENLETNAKTVYEYCVQNGFRYSDRLHIRMYNDLQGV